MIEMIVSDDCKPLPRGIKHSVSENTEKEVNRKMIESIVLEVIIRDRSR